MLRGLREGKLHVALFIQVSAKVSTGPRLKVRPLTGGSDEMFRGRRIGIFAIRDAHNEVRRRGREGEVGVRLGRFQIHQVILLCS